MVEVVSEFRLKFAELAFLPVPFKVLKPEELPKKAKKTRDYDEIIEFKNYIRDLAIVGVEVPENKGVFQNNLEVTGSNQGIFTNPAMRFEPRDEKYRGYLETEEVYLARDSYPEKFYDDYWLEGIDDTNNQEADMVVDELVNNPNLTRHLGKLDAGVRQCARRGAAGDARAGFRRPHQAPSFYR